MKPVDDKQQVSARALVALIALAVTAFVYVTAESLPIGLLLPMSASLHVTSSAVGLLVTAYALVVVLATVPLAHVTRRLPRRGVLCGLLLVFVLASAYSGAASSYSPVLAARIVMALSQALFWALVIPTAADLVPTHTRGRAIAAVFAGVSVANAAGVPGGTWLGQHAGWHVAFLAIGGVGAVALLVLAMTLPRTTLAAGPSERGQQPDARRYWLTVAVTGMGAAGTFVAFTYLGPFLTTVTHLPQSAVGPILLGRGVASILGVAAGGQIADHSPRVALLVPITLQALAFIGLLGSGRSVPLAVTFLFVSGFSFTALTTSLGSRVLLVAPCNVNLAFAFISTAVNVGISGGALMGAVLLAGAGIQSTVVVAALISSAAVAFAFWERAVPSARAARRSNVAAGRATIMDERECVTVS